MIRGIVGSSWGEAVDLIEEFDQFHAEGPPYRSPNADVLRRRDQAHREQLDQLLD